MYAGREVARARGKRERWDGYIEAGQARIASGPPRCRDAGRRPGLDSRPRSDAHHE